MTVVPPPLSQATAYGVVVGVGLAFAFGMMGITRALRYYLKEDSRKSETFLVANRNVGIGLTASAVVSSWAWTTALLSSSVVAYNFGVSGSYWFAAGCICQITLFALIAIICKLRAPNAHTVLEIIRVRYGRGAHILYMVLCLINNLIAVANMLLGASAVVNALTGMNIIAANFLLPLGVVVYTTTGGLKATFLTDWMHTTIILIIIVYFATSFFRSPLIGSPDHLYDLLVAASQRSPVDGNYKGSLLTMSSKGGILFGIIHTLGNFGLVIMDTSFWQKGFAADIPAAIPGYVLGGVSYFSLPWCLGTLMGTYSFSLAARALENTPAFPTYPEPMTTEQVNAGLVVPFAAMALTGTGGAGAVLVITFMACTSTTSAQVIAVSSLLSFDLYRGYINCEATDRQTIRASHLGVIGFALVMAAFSTGLQYAGVSLNWTLYFLGIVVCPGMITTVLTVLWRRQSRIAAIVSPIAGMASGFAVWLSTSYKFGDGINVNTTGLEIPCMYGTLASAFVPVPFTIALTYLFPSEPFEWSAFGSIKLVLDNDDSASGKEILVHKGHSDAQVAYMKRGAKVSAILGSIIFLVTWVITPFSLYRPYIFGKSFFSGWVVVATIWAWLSLLAVGIYPLIEGRRTIWLVTTNVFRHYFLRHKSSAAHVVTQPETLADPEAVPETPEKTLPGTPSRTVSVADEQAQK